MFGDFEDKEKDYSFKPEDFEEDDGFFFESEEDKQEQDDFRDEEYDEDDSTEGKDRIVGREIGIDLGTTNSVIAYIDKNGAIKFIKVKNEVLIPSFIFYKDKDTIYFGKKAKSYAKAMTQGATVSLFKKYLRADSKKIKVRLPKTEALGEDGKKYYIIDTNVLIDQPDILDYFEETDVIILPITVEQELEYRATDINTKYSAEKALEELAKQRDRIKFEESNNSLLPKDFFRSFMENSSNSANNDNKILTIALKYKEQNPTLISSDSGLKLKSKFVGIKGISLKEFNLEKRSKSKFDEFELTGTEATELFLGYLKREAEKALKQPVSKAVITVPATFNIVEIENTKKAGLDAGFLAIHIEKEPTAAAIAYNIDTNDESSTFIYDFGGGTFDVSIIESDGESGFKVCATAGNSKLGGEDLTKEIEKFVYGSCIKCSEKNII